MIDHPGDAVLPRDYPARQQLRDSQHHDGLSEADSGTSGELASPSESDVNPPGGDVATGSRWPLRRRMRWVAIGVIGLLWALFSPSLGSALLPSTTVDKWIEDLFGDDPTPVERSVDRYVNEVRHATAWVDPPTIHKPSVAYMKRHFGEMDPDRPHAFPPIDRQPHVSVADLIIGAPVLVGRRLTVSGNLAGEPTAVTPTRDGGVSWAFAIRDTQVPRAFIFARVPIKGEMTFTRGDRVTVAGVLIADGAAPGLGRQGLQRIVYLAASAVAHSANITIVGAKKRRRP